MDRGVFDHVIRAIAVRSRRRALGELLGGGAAALVVAWLADAPATEAVERKRRVAGEHNVRGSNVILCYQGKTVRKPKKQRKKWLKRGATRGPCSGCTPSCSGCGGNDGCGGTCGCTSPAVCFQSQCCTPTCNGTDCGGDDGCGGICGCAAGQLCDAVGSTCAACDVQCTGTPVECGATLAAAFVTLAGGTLYVCPGTYQGNFTIGAGSVIGAGSGTDPASNTILNGNGAGRTLVANTNAASTKLATLRITGGLASGVGTDSGGGLFAGIGTTVQLANCVVAGNSGESGGGITAEVTTLTLTNCEVSDNSAKSGGGVFSDNSTCTFIDTLITDNHATEEDGGGLVAYSSTLNFENTQLTLNTAFQDGGGLALGNSFATATFDSDCSVTQNTASLQPIGSYEGGGIRNFNATAGSLTLNGATVIDNAPDDCVGVGC
ncbi:MAG: hypothetical protein QM692_01840 [Thermomicrobiales bacterium]